MKSIPASDRLREISDLLRQVREVYIREAERKIETMKRMQGLLNGRVGKD